jgi:hypothetical protein
MPAKVMQGVNIGTLRDWGRLGGGAPSESRGNNTINDNKNDRIIL